MGQSRMKQTNTKGYIIKMDVNGEKKKRCFVVVSFLLPAGE
jgi:hypothetical protein